MLRSWIFAFSIASFVASDDVIPCVSDVVIVVDGTTGMRTTDNVVQEIKVIESLVSNWTLSDTGVRVAILADSIADDYDCPDYFDDREELLQHLKLLQRKSTAYGLYPGSFKELARFLGYYYVNGYRTSRLNVPKVVLIFSSYNNKQDVNLASKSMTDFYMRDFHVSIVGIDVNETVYSGVEHHRFFSLPSEKMRKVGNEFLMTLEDEAITHWCRRHSPPITSTTTTTPQTTTPGATSLVTTAKNLITTTTTPYKTTPIPPPDISMDYLNCSCTEHNLWLDIVFIIDVSASMSRESLIEIFANIITLANDFTFDRSEDRHVRIGVVAVANKVAFYEHNITKFSELMDALDKIKSTDEKQINILLGLKESQRILRRFDRENAHDVIVIYSSSFKKGDVNDPTTLANQLKISGTQIITVAFVGTGQTDLVRKLGTIASPRMNFTTYGYRDIAGKILDGFCQANCFCPKAWHHLILNDRRYGECFYLTEIDADWKSSSKLCLRLQATHSHLAYINSEEKQKTLEKYGTKKYESFQWPTPVKYHIGLSYKAALKTYLWEFGAVNTFYNNWDVNYPNPTEGECVLSQAGSDGKLRWRNEKCRGARTATKAMCQGVTCDTNNYCPPQK